MTASAETLTSLSLVRHSARDNNNNDFLRTLSHFRNLQKLCVIACSGDPEWNSSLLHDLTELKQLAWIAPCSRSDFVQLDNRLPKLTKIWIRNEHMIDDNVYRQLCMLYLKRNEVLEVIINGRKGLNMEGRIRGPRLHFNNIGDIGHASNCVNVFDM